MDAPRPPDLALSHVPGYAVVVDGAGTIIAANGACQRVWGPCAGRALTSLVPPADHPEIVAMVEAARHGASRSIRTGIAAPSHTGLVIWQARGLDGLPGQALIIGLEVPADVAPVPAGPDPAQVLRLAVDALPDWLFAKDHEHRFLFVNAAFAASQRRAAADLIGHRDVEFWPHHALDRSGRGHGFHDDDLAALRGETIHRPSYELTFGDGRTRILDLLKQPLRDEHGAVRGVLVHARDVTDHRQVEAALRESERRFRAVFEQAGVGVAQIETVSGRFVHVNRKYTELIGYSAEEMTQRDFMTISHPDELAADLAAMRRLVAGEIREFSMEKRLFRKDGQAVWVSLAVSPMWAPGEPATHHIAVVQDITARRDAEAQLRRATEDLRSTLSALPDLMFELDAEYRIQDFRAPDPALLAVAPAQFLGQPVDAVLPAEAAQVIRRAGDEAIQHGASRGHTYRLTLGDQERWFELSIARKATDTGRPRLVAIARDVTDRVEAEARRASLEAQLRQAQKMEAVGQLAGGVAHDFNNLLHAITLGLDILSLELEPGHPTEATVGVIAQATARARDLVQQILAFSRKQPSHRQVIALATVVDEATRLLRATVPVGVRFDVTVAEAPAVLADRTQLVQVLLNLGTNAWHAIGSRPGTIRLALDRVTVGAADWARITVSDDGAGMTPQVMDRIFEPFFTTKPVGEGSGLGLAVVHGIVAEHGGTISVTSEVGVGSRFEVRLPAADGRAVDVTPAATVAVPGPRRLRVAYVDDEVEVVRATIKLLERAGHQVQGFTHPHQVIAAVGDAPDRFDVIITDLNMPDASGLDVARAVRAVRADLPVVLVSGYVRPGDDDLRRAGVVARLDKPFTAETLTEALARLRRRGT